MGFCTQNTCTLRHLSRLACIFVSFYIYDKEEYTVKIFDQKNPRFTKNYHNYTDKLGPSDTKPRFLP